MLRIHVTDEDLAWVRAAAGPDPLWEIAFSLRLLHSHDGETVFGGWRRYARTKLSDSSVLRESTRLLASMYSGGARPAGFRAAAAASLSGGTIASGPIVGGPIVGRTMSRGPVPGGPVPGGPVPGGGLLSRTGAALRDYYEALIAPYHAQIQALAETCSAVQARRMLHGGAQALLSTLGPAIRWQPPVLEVDGPAEGEVAPGGRGLLLVPSYFCWRQPTYTAGPGTPALVFPLTHPPHRPARAGAGGRRAGQRLAALLGPTRAAVLATVPGGCTTTELSRRLGISPAAASRHATVLRDAGLVSTAREANMAIHTLTTLGAAVLSTGHPID